jgi:hypothetical protein
MYRGQSSIINNTHCEITLPKYCSAWFNFNVIVSPVNSINPYLYASEVIDNTFYVYGINGVFNWTVYGTRLLINTEPYKHNNIVKGEGPYKFLEKI